MRNWLAAIAAVLICLGSGFSNGTEETDVIEVFETGYINWTKGIFVSKGIGVPGQKETENTAYDPDMVINDSRNQALKNMLSTMLKTDIRANLTVADVAAANKLIMDQIEILAKGAKVVKQETMPDGTVEIRMERDMFGGFSQLVLPEEIKQIEAIKTVSTNKVSTTEMTTDSSQLSAVKAYTGLVVDARGTKAEPALAPAILDEKGKEVYGGAFVSREFAVQKGMSRYVREIKTAQEDSSVTDHPLVVKGLRTDADVGSNIVISDADASKIRSASEHLTFMKQCRVIIVMD